MKRHRLELVRADAPIDRGVRDLVRLFNQIAGVITRASCEGSDGSSSDHRHAAIAYVAFRHPLPLNLQEFLAKHVGVVARLEDDAVYSRWPAQNAAFLDNVLAAVRAYLTQVPAAGRVRLCWALPRLRARLARHLSNQQPFRIQLCRQCLDLVLAPHAPAHDLLALLQCPAGLAGLWFVEFLQQPSNALDPALIVSDGWANLLARTQRGEFGGSFQRRWLRYRSRKLAELATSGFRSAAAEARRQGHDLDCFYTDTQLILEWTKPEMG